MKNLAVKTQLGLIVILALFALSLILSQRANPDSTLLFGLKRFQEIHFLKLKSDPISRVDYMSSMLDSRLEELKNVVNNKSYDYVLPSASRYSTLAGQITDFVISNNLKEKPERIKNQFLSHKKFLQNIYVIYPKNIPDNEEWKYIQDDYNYLNIYLDKLSSLK